MAHSKNSLLLHNFSGRVGNLVIKRYGDKTVLSAVANMDNRVLSAKQKEYNILMKYANKYAKYIVSDPVKKEEACRARLLPPNRIFRALVKEYMLNKGNVEGFPSPPAR